MFGNQAVTVDFVRALSHKPIDRTQQDVVIIYSYIRRLDVFHRLGDSALRAVCKSARYERHYANEILYRKTHLSTCWYILISGSVFIDGHMYLPPASFGKRAANNNRRTNDCLVLEPSEMIVIDYPDVHQVPITTPYQRTSTTENRKTVQSMNLDDVAFGAGASSSHRRLPPPPPPAPLRVNSHSSSSSTVSLGSAISSNGPTPPSSLMRLSKKYAAAHRPSQSGGHDSTDHCPTNQHGRTTNLYRTSSNAEPLREVETVIQHSEVYVPTNHHHTNSHHGHSGHNGNKHGMHRTHSSRSSTSSAYSGSIDHPAHSTGDNDDELSGLPEGNVDSDEEDDESTPSADSFMELRDCVRECLEKEPEARTEDDLVVLLDFMQHMPAFANLPVSVKKDLCWKMVFAVVETAGNVVMDDGEELDSWSVIVNGEVEVVLPSGKRIEFHLGDSFGVNPSTEKQFHVGTMRTLVDDCQFVLVQHTDYVNIMSRKAEHCKKNVNEAGEIVSETERRTLENREGYVLIKAKTDKLIGHLVEERDTSVDPYFVEDFLLMHRAFINNPVTIFEKLIAWFDDDALRDKVVRIVLLWVNNHFNDFETNGLMMNLLEEFERQLERREMLNQQALLNIACSVKSRSRTLTYTRSNREEQLHFTLLGGNDKNGLYISNVTPQSPADKVGLKRGDQILEVNNNNFQHISFQKALEILRGSTHISITVKSNLLGFKEMISADKTDSNATPAVAPNGRVGLIKEKGHQHSASCANVLSNGGVPHGNAPLSSNTHSFSGVHMMHKERPAEKVSTSGLKKIMRNIVKGVSNLGVNENGIEDVSYDPNGCSQRVKMQHSRSNPDISNNGNLQSQQNLSHYYTAPKNACPEHVLKIYRSDQTSKFLTVYKETTAQNVVQLARQEFGMTAEGDSSLQWSLCEVTVTPEGVTKHRRLPDQMHNLAERIGLHSRYYIKNNNSSAALITDELGSDILKEAAVQLHQLNAQILAAQLTLQDFAVFATIEPTEYVDFFFRLKSPYGTDKLQEFEKLVNKEMWWVMTEVCREKNVFKRVKLIKKFIKVARHCKEIKNFNSMFAIISALDKPAVLRLANTWNKVPAKHTKTLDDMKSLLDPSRNMSKYRSHLTMESVDPPVIPIYPVHSKDLTFIDQGNKTWCDQLVNFEKLRMFAKEVRNLTNLSSSPYDLTSMFERPCNSALLHMNTFDSTTAVATMPKQGAVTRPNLPRKKLYEQALMVRKVKFYLETLHIIEKEDDLDKMSHEIEPQVGSGSMSNMQARKRHPSPSPSSISSQSNTSDRLLGGPKFGADSPHARQKMMSLVDNVRPAQLQTRPSAPSALSLQHQKHLKEQSPSSSRRLRQHRLGSASDASTKRGAYSRSQSESNPQNPCPPVNPVDLNAECSSVTALLTPAARISSTGSVTSTDSGVSQQSVNISHAVSCDSTDSGHASIEANSQHNPNSPPSTRRSYPPPPNNMNGVSLPSSRTRMVVAPALTMNHRAHPFFHKSQPQTKTSHAHSSPDSLKKRTTINEEDQEQVSRV